MRLEKIFRFIDQNRDPFIRELLPLVAQPSISATGEGIEECAGMLARMMGSLGIETRILPAGGYPVVYGEVRAPSAARTLLLLCHYDVVPPGPMEDWKNPPFEPMIRDNRIWARGAGDAKGQLFACLKALEAWNSIHGEIPCTIRLVFIGDEEIGCSTLPSVVEKYRSMFRADAVLFLDASTLDVEGPVVYLANRGVLAIELVARGAGTQAHSGSYGGLLRNPAFRLAQAIGTMRDDTGRILIQGFYEHLQPLGETEKALLSRLVLNREKKLHTLGAAEFWGDPGYNYFETQMYRPTLNIHSLTSGYQERGWMAVVPATARAKIDMNIVPNLDPGDLKQKIRRHLDERGFQDIEIVELARIPYACGALPDDPFLRAVSSAQRMVWGMDPVIYPSIGGGGDLTKVFKEQLGNRHFLMVPLGQPDMNEHSPHENFDLDWFIRGIKVIAATLAEFGAMEGRTSEEA
jgi:acetylornithine deacetylase/succinyl-diaminopimelate desuccinylase-like protein